MTNGSIYVAAYQILDKAYADAVIKPSRIKNEYTAICEMIDRCNKTHGIPLFMADRGFPSYNCFAHAKEKMPHILYVQKMIM